MNESMDTFNSSLNDVKSVASGKRLSKVFPADIEENDDTTEKQIQNRRNSNLFGLGLNSKSSRSTDKPKEKTATEITAHYGTCIKLATENKITSKNAFDLHLINYLKDYMHSLESFQNASSSLMAGAKIYAGRVDVVHSNTYNILTGTGGAPDTDADVETVTDPIVNPENEDIEDIKIKKPKKRADIHKNMTVTNIRKIRLTSAQIRAEDDPLSKSQGNKFDEGNTGELRINNLKLMDDSYGLLMDFDTLVSNKCVDNENISDLVFDISDFEDKFLEICNDESFIPIYFDDFKFTEWNSDSDVMNPEAVESYRNLKLMEDSLQRDNNQNSNDDDFIGDDYDDGYAGGCCNNEDNHDITIVNDTDKPLHVNEDIIMKEDENEDNLLRIGSSKYDNASSMFVSSVKDMVNSYMENYGEINDNILGMWAGPDHWKKKAKPIKLFDNNLTKVKLKKLTKTIKAIKPMFDDWVPTKLNEDGIGRLVDIHREDVNQIAKASTQLTDTCLNNNIKKEYVLPQRSQFVLKSINQLMNRDISLVNKAMRKCVEQMTNIDLQDEVVNDVNNNANEIFELIDKDMIVVDDDGNISNDIINGDGDYFSDNDDPYTGNSLIHDNFVDYEHRDNELDYQIRNPEPVGINYAKTAKRINAKKLKNDIMSFLSERVHMIDYNEINNKPYPILHLSKEVCQLSEVIINVDKNTSCEISKELSVSILMTCLLHLVNETGIDISNVEDYSDFILGQGYSAYDMEQIKLWGIGNVLYRDSRKRNSIDNIGLGKAKTAHITDDSDSE